MGSKPFDGCIYEAILVMLYVALCKFMHAPFLPISNTFWIDFKAGWHDLNMNIKTMVSLWFSTSCCLMNVFCGCGNLIEVGLRLPWF